jgi:hypothetical protein
LGYRCRSGPAAAVPRGTPPAFIIGKTVKPETHDSPYAVARVAVHLAQAEHRVRLLRRAALVDGRYSPREFDRAVQETRRLRLMLTGNDPADPARTDAEERRAA